MNSDVTFAHSTTYDGEGHDHRYKSVLSKAHIARIVQKDIPRTETRQRPCRINNVRGERGRVGNPFSVIRKVTVLEWALCVWVSLKTIQELMAGEFGAVVTAQNLEGLTLKVPLGSTPQHWCTLIISFTA